MPAPIDPTIATAGLEWQVPGVEQSQPAAPSTSFGDELAGALESLQATQVEAASAGRDLATGQVSDPTDVIMAVERARLSMELASQLRNKAVEAYQEIFRTQV